MRKSVSRGSNPWIVGVRVRVRIRSRVRVRVTATAAVRQQQQGRPQHERHHQGAFHYPNGREVHA